MKHQSTGQEANRHYDTLLLSGRKNALHTAEEQWRPPLLLPSENLVRKVMAIVRRFFDLQAGSIWRDLSGELNASVGTFVDVGCGGQLYRQMLPAQVRYIGIDIAQAKDRFGYEMPGTIYYSGNIWPISDASADTILITEVLEHVIDPAPFLLEAHRCLKAGGRLLLTVPFAARWHFIPHDYWRFTPSGLKHLLTQAAFQEIRIYGRGNAVTVACYKNMALVLALLVPQRGNLFKRILSVVAGSVALPLLLFFAIIANISFHFETGDDCLGYTVIARKSE